MIETFINYISDKNSPYVIFDIGSRDCEQSIEFYKTFPNSKIYAFECNPNTLDLCEQNIIPYQDRITLIKGAVCDYDGSITFYPINQEKTKTTWKDGNPGASLFKSNGNYDVETYVQDEITTNCHRLDTIMSKYKIPRVHIISMDLQGAELLALKGLGNKLSSVEYIHTKACHKAIYTDQALFPEINNYLTNLFPFKILNNISSSSDFEDVIYKNKFIKDPIYQNINLSFQQQTYERGKPKEYLLHTIKLFNKYTDGKTILEIGSSRSIMNHSIQEFNPVCCNDGHATYFFKHYTDAEIFSVDIDPQCKKIIDSDSRLNGVNGITKCGFKYADDIDYNIDFLYLDAWDVIPGSSYAESHLEIYNKLKDKLSVNCLILIDDTDVGNGGKGKLVIPQLIKDGFLMIFNRRQTLFLRNLDIKHSLYNAFDIVIPLGPNDKSIIEEQIKYTQKNVIGYRNIYLICYDPSIKINDCITISEDIFPFDIKTVAKYHGELERNGWYLQQLLKLYAGKIIPDILDRYLVIDSDTFFLKPTTFIHDNKCLYNYGTEYHEPYFEHMKKLDNDLTKMVEDKSGICHHMIFEKKYINELMTRIEKNHNEMFYDVFLKNVTDKNGSGASEYEIYFNYMLKYNPDKIQIRTLDWKNTDKLETDTNYDYISYHWHMR